MKTIVLFITATLIISTQFHIGFAVENRVSPSCYVSVMDCLERVARLNQQQTNDVCKLMTTVYRSVTAYHCLVKVGLCTEAEYDILKIIACQDSVALQSASALAKLRLYRTMNNASKSCMAQVLVCIRRYITAIVLKQQEHYCALINLDINGITSKACVSENGACSEENYKSINDAACDAELLNKKLTPFVLAIQSASSLCKHTIEICYSKSQKVRLLINSEHYCDVMNIEENSTSTHSCLVRQGSCTEKEFDDLKQSACIGVSLTMGILTCILCLVLSIIQQK